jgi:glutathione S-transferase
MRGWLMVKLARLEVEETVLPMSAAKTAAITAISPNGLVPYLEHDGAKVWESLAIAEYCAEFAPSLWPAERPARAHARSIASQMHAGFRALRTAMPMNLGRDFAGLGQTPEGLDDIAQIDRLFTTTRATYGAGGPFLFGANFNAADAMFAPVVARFLTYAPPLSEPASAYCHAVRAHPLVDLWYRLALQEPESWLLDKYESLACT